MDIIFPCDDTFGIVDNGINTVFHDSGHVMVRKAHVGTRSHIVLGVDDFTVAGDDNLIDGGKVFEMNVLRWIGPLDGGGIIEVAAGFHGKVFGLHGHVVVDISRHIVENGLCPTGIVNFVDDEPAVAAAAPTPVEVEEVVIIVAVAHKGMAAAVAET